MEQANGYNENNEINNENQNLNKKKKNFKKIFFIVFLIFVLAAAGYYMRRELLKVGGINEKTKNNILEIDEYSEDNALNSSNGGNNVISESEEVCKQRLRESSLVITNELLKTSKEMHLPLISDYYNCLSISNYVNNDEYFNIANVSQLYDKFFPDDREKFYEDVDWFSLVDNLDDKRYEYYLNNMVKTWETIVKQNFIKSYDIYYFSFLAMLLPEKLFCVDGRTNEKFISYQLGKWRKKGIAEELITERVSRTEKMCRLIDEYRDKDIEELFSNELQIEWTNDFEKDIGIISNIVSVLMNVGKKNDSLRFCEEISDNHLEYKEYCNEFVEIIEFIKNCTHNNQCTNKSECNNLKKDIIYKLCS